MNGPVKTLIVAALLLLRTPVAAQVIDTQQVSAVSTGSGCTAVASSCATFLLGNSPSVTLQVSGTFSGTLTFETTSDGINWVAASVTTLSSLSTATTTTTTGQFSYSNVGSLQVRARATAWTSGTATVVATRGYSTARAITGGSGGIGTVTSVGLSLPSFLSVSGSPVTTAGTLAVTAATETANLVFAGPTSGGALAPTFRALVSADLPAGVGTVTSVAATVPSTLLAVSGTPITTTGTLAITLPTRAANLVFAGPATGADAAPTFRALVAADVPSSITIGDTQVAFGNGANVIGGDAGLVFVRDDSVGAASRLLTQTALGTTANIESGVVDTGSGTGDAYVRVRGQGSAGDGNAFISVSNGSAEGTAVGVYGTGQIQQFTKTGTDALQAWDDAGNVLRFAIKDAGLTLGDGIALQTNATDANTAVIRAYDVDGTAYKTFATLTNGNTPSFALAQPAGGSLTINGLTYPTADGSAGQFISTNGTGTLSFTAPATTTVNNIKFNNGKGVQTNIVANDTVLFQAYDTDDAVYRTMATLTAGVTPNFDIASPTGATLSLTLGSDATGDIFYRNSSGKLARLPIGSATNVLTVASGLPSWAAAASGGGALSSITAATGANTIASGNNHSQVWNWALTTDSKTAFTFGETTAATSGTGQNQALVTINTLATSTAEPLRINCYGATTPNCLQVDDVSGDTTPFFINSSGAIGINIAPFTTTTYMLDIGSSGASSVVRFTQSGGSVGDFSGPAWGSISNNDFWIGANSSASIRVSKTGPYTNIYRSAAPTTVVATTPYLQLGGAEGPNSGYMLIGFGYNNNANNGETGIPPADFGFQYTSTSGSTKGDLVMLIRNGTTNVAGTERMRLTSDGLYEFVNSSVTSTGTVPTISGCSADTQTGGAYAGTFTSRTTGTCAVTLTLALTQPTGYSCSYANVTTTANLYQQSGGTTATATSTGTTVTGDVIRWHCIGY